MKVVPQLEIWQTASGNYQVNYVGAFRPHIDNWLIPCRAMNMEPALWVKKIKETYHPDSINHNSSYTLVYFSWKNETDARKYKNDMNKIIRNNNFTIDI